MKTLTEEQYAKVKAHLDKYPDLMSENMGTVGGGTEAIGRYFTAVDLWFMELRKLFAVGERKMV